MNSTIALLISFTSLYFIRETEFVPSTYRQSIIHCNTCSFNLIYFKFIFFLIMAPRKTQFQSEWLKTYPWLARVKGDGTRAFCKVCQKSVLILDKGDSAITDHANGTKHTEAIKQQVKVFYSIWKICPRFLRKLSSFFTENSLCPHLPRVLATPLISSLLFARHSIVFHFHT